MSPNILLETEKIKETEKAVKQEQVENNVDESIEVEQETVKQNILKNSTQPLYVPKNETLKEEKEEIKSINLFSASAFEKETVAERKKLFENCSAEKEKVEEKIEIEEKIEVEKVVESVEEEDFQEQVFEIQPKQKKKRTSKNFRLKLFTAVFCVFLAATTGWVITNSVRVSNLNNAIETTQKSHEANELKLIKNLNKIKDLESKDPSTDTSLDIIEEVIKIQPLPLENFTDYQETSNFFDALCNLISGLFGG